MGRKAQPRARGVDGKADGAPANSQQCPNTLLLCRLCSVAAKDLRDLLVLHKEEPPTQACQDKTPDMFLPDNSRAPTNFKTVSGTQAITSGVP